MVRLNAVREALRLSLWFVPAVFAGIAIVLALVLMAVDQSLGREPGSALFMFGGTADGARSVLSTIAQSMLTFTGLVFTITMLVLQLASSQLSPRVMRTFLRDRGNQAVLGLFTATFVFTLLVLREVRNPSAGDPGFVPAVSIWVAFLLLLASVGAFIWYIDHMAHAIRASTVITSIWSETVGAIERLYPERIADDDLPPAALPDLGAPPIILKSDRAGVVVTVDEAALLRATEEPGRLLDLVPAVGDFVPAGAPLARVWGVWDRTHADQVRRAVGLNAERTLDQDAAFGFRQLVDIAIRALSPGTNDPTTAVQAIDRLHDLLRRLAVRRFPSPVRVVDGRPRLVLPQTGWDDYVRLALDEIRLAGEGQIQVLRRLRAVLDDLAAIAPPSRRPALVAQVVALDVAVDRGLADPADRVIARTASARGHARGAAKVDPRR
jgi:uncharacterized membrane protein